MARQLRIQIPGGIHHVGARGNDRQPLFIDDADRRTFLSVLSEATNRHGCSIHAFCLMDNHVHLVVEDSRAELSKCLQQLNGRYAQRFNRKHGRTGHVFEGRFWNSLLDTDAYLTTAVEYVHRNPIEAAIVENLSDYRWSSYPVYLGLRRAPKFLETATVLAYYGDDTDAFRSSTESRPRDLTKEQQLSARHPAPILGDEEFKQRTVAEAKRSEGTEAARRKLNLEGRWPIEAIACASASVFNVERSALDQTVRGQHNRARSAAIHLAHTEAGWPLSVIAESFDLSASAVSMASSRFQLLIEKEEATARSVDLLRLRLTRTEQVAS